MAVSENSVPLNPMVLLIIIPMKNGYFIGNINPTFSDKPKYLFVDSQFLVEETCRNKQPETAIANLGPGKAAFCPLSDWRGEFVGSYPIIFNNHILSYNQIYMYIYIYITWNHPLQFNIVDELADLFFTGWVSPDLRSSTAQVSESLTKMEEHHKAPAIRRR